MYKLCKTDQSVRRQREIEDALLEAMLCKRYEDITVSDLCDGIGIPRKSFYRYFSGKEGCLQAMLDHRLMEYPNQEGTENVLRISGLALNLDWFYKYWITQKDLLNALSRNGLGGMLVERAVHHSQVAQIFADGMHNADYVRHVTAFLVCGIMSLVLRWHSDGFLQSPEEMAAMTREMLRNPLIPQQ